MSPKKILISYFLALLSLLPSKTFGEELSNRGFSVYNPKINLSENQNILPGKTYEFLVPVKSNSAGPLELEIGFKDGEFEKESSGWVSFLGSQNKVSLPANSDFTNLLFQVRIPEAGVSPGYKEFFVVFSSIPENSGQGVSIALSAESKVFFNLSPEDQNFDPDVSVSNIEFFLKPGKSSSFKIGTSGYFLPLTEINFFTGKLKSDLEVSVLGKFKNKSEFLVDPEVLFSLEGKDADFKINAKNFRENFAIKLSKNRTEKELNLIDRSLYFGEEISLKQPNLFDISDSLPKSESSLEKITLRIKRPSIFSTQKAKILVLSRNKKIFEKEISIRPSIWFLSVVLFIYLTPILGLFAFILVFIKVKRRKRV